MIKTRSATTCCQQLSDFLVGSQVCQEACLLCTPATKVRAKNATQRCCAVPSGIACRSHYALCPDRATQAGVTSLFPRRPGGARDRVAWPACASGKRAAAGAGPWAPRAGVGRPGNPDPATLPFPGTLGGVPLPSITKQIVS